MSAGGPGSPGPPPGPADRIEIRGLTVDAVHGVLPEEQVTPQPFEVDLDLHVDLSGAASADALEAAADYGAAVSAAASVLGGPPRQLLETLAEDIATAVLAAPSLSAVRAVTVSVRKLRPPVPERVTSAGVRLTRGRA